MTFERSHDYAAIAALILDPRCRARMQNPIPRGFTVEATKGAEYVLGRDETGSPVAVFVVLEGVEVHMCFAPRVWGSTATIAAAFLHWWWSHTDGPLLVGPVPKRNRLALKLAKASGFQEYPMEDPNLIYTYLKRPAA